MRMLNRLGMAGGAAFLLAALAAGGEKEVPASQYVGVAACGKCHKRTSTGNQLAQWQETGHARAYETLGTPEAAEVAEKAGVTGNPQEAAQCLKCHVTAYGAEASQIVEPPAGKPGFLAADGVQCEACHGAGSLFKKMKIMKDRETAVAAGLVIPGEALCVSCHNAESPTYQGFEFEEMWKEVLHPNPKKAPAQE